MAGAQSSPDTTAGRVDWVRELEHNWLLAHFDPEGQEALFGNRAY